jgi:hypothetical protein
MEMADMICSPDILGTRDYVVSFHHTQYEIGLGPFVCFVVAFLSCVTNVLVVRTIDGIKGSRRFEDAANARINM